MIIKIMVFTTSVLLKTDGQDDLGLAVLMRHKGWADLENWRYQLMPGAYEILVESVINNPRANILESVHDIFREKLGLVTAAHLNNLCKKGELFPIHLSELEGNETVSAKKHVYGLYASDFDPNSIRLCAGDGCLGFLTQREVDEQIARHERKQKSLLKEFNRTVKSHLRTFKKALAGRRSVSRLNFEGIPDASYADLLLLRDGFGVVMKQIMVSRSKCPVIYYSHS